MRKRWSGVWQISLGEYWNGLAVTGSCFAVGGLLGCLLASWIGGAGSDGLTSYIQSFLQAAQGEYAASPAILPLLWEQVRYPLAVVLLSFTALGVIAIPALFGLRGFFLSFAISAFVRMFGGDGIVFALILFGLSGVISVPVLFVLGAQGWQRSCTLAGRGGKRRKSDGGDRFFSLGICAACILLCVLIEHFCTLRLLIWTAGVL